MQLPTGLAKIVGYKPTDIHNNNQKRERVCWLAVTGDCKVVYSIVTPRRTPEGINSSNPEPIIRLNRPRADISNSLCSE